MVLLQRRSGSSVGEAAALASRYGIAWSHTATDLVMVLILEVLLCWLLVQVLCDETLVLTAGGGGGGGMEGRPTLQGNRTDFSVGGGGGGGEGEARGP